MNTFAPVEKKAARLRRTASNYDKREKLVNDQLLHLRFTCSHLINPDHIQARCKLVQLNIIAAVTHPLLQYLAGRIQEIYISFC